MMVTGRQWARTTPPADLGLHGLFGKPFDLDELVGLIASAAKAFTQDSAKTQAVHLMPVDHRSV